eukprot:g55654.t1
MATDERWASKGELEDKKRSFHAFPKGSPANVKVKCTDEQLKCHSQIISLHSEVFSAAMQTFKEKHTIHVDFSAKHFSVFLKAVYSSNIIYAKLFTHSEVVILYCIAHQYGCQTIENDCIKTLSDNMTNGVLSDKFKNPQLKDLCLRSLKFTSSESDLNALESFLLPQKFPPLLKEILRLGLPFLNLQWASEFAPSTAHEISSMVSLLMQGTKMELIQSAPSAPLQTKFQGAFVESAAIKLRLKLNTPGSLHYDLYCDVDSNFSLNHGLQLYMKTKTWAFCKYGRQKLELFVNMAATLLRLRPPRTWLRSARGNYGSRSILKTTVSVYSEERKQLRGSECDPDSRAETQEPLRLEAV